MADVKIEEIKYFNFLSLVQSLIDNLNSYSLSDTDYTKQILIKDFLEKEFQKRELMLERKQYYDFYIKNRNINETIANESYQKYVIIRNKLKNLEGDNNEQKIKLK